MPEEFHGLSAVITGSGSGIGRATAIMMANKGATVFGLDLDRGSLPENLEWIRCDVRSGDEINNAFEAIGSKVSQIDIIVNCAGVGAVGTIETASEAEWHSVYDTNVVGTARVSARALPLLRKSSSATIVNICSIAATVGLPERAVYSASKGAVLSLTRAMATDLIKDNIRVNCVNPGTADTPWVERLLEQAPDPEAERVALNARQPMGRLVSAEEVASAVCFLANPLQSSTTGTSLAVDGGMDGLRAGARS